MKYKIILSAILLCSGNVFAAKLKSKSVDHGFAKGRILIEAKAGLSTDELAKILAVHGGKGRKIGQSKVHIVDLPANASEVDIVAMLSKDPNIKFAELDQRIESSYTTNDAYIGYEWHIPKVGINLAWDYTMGAGVTIAILDSGVDMTHPDLVPNLVPGYNFYDNNTNTADVCGHGTAVAGVAAAAGNNTIGVAGVASQSKIMPIRIAYYDSSVGSCYAYTSTISSGITYAADHGVRVVNVSYGPLAGSATIQSAGNYLKNKGGLLFISAGNNGTDLGSPQTTSLITVSATDSNDARTSWSSFGTIVSLAAPGAGIWTTSNGGTYGGWNGTSFSSPLAAGVGALVMSAKPSLSSAQVENLLFSTAVDLGAAGRDSEFGYGRVDANAAVLAALSYSTPVDTTSPSSSITSPSSGASVSGLVTVNISAADNVGVDHVELRVNGSTVAVDNSSPYSISWDSKTVADGSASLVAVAFDAAGNSKSSSAISVSVSNVVVPPPAVDTTAPVIKINSPVAGKVSGTVSVSVSASDDSGAAGLSLTISVDGVVKAKGTGGALSYNWNVRKVSAGTHTIQATATDKAGNKSTTSVLVTK